MSSRARPRRSPFAIAAALSAAVILGEGSTARAQPSDRKAAAQLLFDQARSLEEEGKQAEACSKFAESLKLDSGIGTMLWLADCYETNGQLASAWAQFLEAAGTASMRQDAREKVARERAKELEPRLSKLKITVPQAPAGLDVRRDGASVGSAEWALEVPVDPGDHVLRATAPGKTPWTQRVRVDGPPVVEVTVPPLADAPKGDEPRRVEATPEPVGRTQRTIGLVVGGIGVVGVGVGATLGLFAKSTYDSSNADGHCLADNRCDATGLARRADAGSMATAASVVFVAGIGAIAGGAILFFTAPRGVKTGLRVDPVVTASGAGLAVGSAW